MRSGRTTTSGPNHLNIRFFGAPRLSIDGAPLTFRAPARAMLLLAYLITSRREVQRKPLAFALWPDDSEEAALANLRRHLLLLEDALPASTRPYLEKSRLQVRWIADERSSADTTRYEDAVAEPARYEEAADLYTGDFITTTENEWACAYRQRLRDKQAEVFDVLIARYRDAGDGTRALDYAERAYRFDPWREDRLCDVLRLRNERGDRAGAVAEYITFRNRAREELGVDPLPQTTAVYAQICQASSNVRSAEDLTVAAVPAQWRGRSPYCGLRSFDAEHASVFFGRTVECGEILKKLLRAAERGRPMVLVLGASGTGKSSVLRAGVMPELTAPGFVAGQRAWRTTFLTPSQAEPLIDLAERAGVSRAAAELEPRPLIVVDQLEELFTGAPPVEPAAFLEQLGALVENGAWVILAMRSDFYHHVSEFETLRSLADSESTYLLSGLREEHVGQVIRGPAARAGVNFELDPLTGVGLDEVIRRDAEGAGRLPLLEFALDELYLADVLRAGGRTLTFATYSALGGLAGAIAERAREQCAGLDPSALESVLLSLITLGVGEAPAARTASAQEFTAAPLRAVLDRLVDARLVVASAGAGGGVYRLAHEALLTHWELALELVERARAELHALTRLRASERLWRERGCDDDFLLAPGKALAEAIALQQKGRLLQPELDAFVSASSDRDTSLRLERETDQRERKRLSSQARSARAIAVLVGVAALALSAWALFGAQAANRATKERTFEQAIVADKLERAWSDCGKQRDLCIASIEGWLNTNMPRLSNISFPQVPTNYSVPIFSVSDCKLEFEKRFVDRRTGAIVSREHESADLTELESIFSDVRGFDGGSTEPVFQTLIVQTQGFVKRGDAGYKYFYFNFDQAENERLAERNFRLLADLCSDGGRVF